MDKKRRLTLCIEDSFPDTATAATSEKSVQRPATRSFSLSKRPSPRHIRHSPYSGPPLPAEVEPKVPKAPHSTTNARNSSSDTLHEDPMISNEFNNRTMLVSFAHTFNVQKVMRRLFPHRDRQSSARAPLRPIISPKSCTEGLRKLHPQPTDSLFSKEEADLILAETVRNQRATKCEKWQEFMQTLKTHPKMMMSLVPLSVHSPKSPRRLSLNRSSMTHRGLTLISPPVPRPPSPQVPLHPTSRSSINASMTEEEVESLMTKADDNLTEDWSKSILYRLVKTGVGRFNEAGEKGVFSEEELETWQANEEDIDTVYVKALRTLEQLLVEMLGTREDAERFQEKYSKCSVRNVKHLVTKCQELLQLRAVLCTLLVAVRQRERDFRALCKEADPRILKPRVLSLYRQGQSIQRQISDWLRLEPPFSCFLFRGQNYLDRITAQNLEAFLQLAKTVLA